jgi:hypothetical protein
MFSLHKSQNSLAALSRKEQNLLNLQHINCQEIDFFYFEPKDNLRQMSFAAMQKAVPTEPEIKKF